MHPSYLLQLTSSLAGLVGISFFYLQPALAQSNLVFGRDIVISPDGQQITILGGPVTANTSFTTDADNILIPRVTTTSVNGTTISPDGWVSYPNGTIISPNGWVTHPDSTVISPSGWVSEFDGRLISPSGQVTIFGNR